MNGFLAAWVPQFPLQALHWAEPQWAQARVPQAVIETSGPWRQVAAANALARRQGIETGTSEAQARWQAPQLIVHRRATWAEQRLQAWLAERLEGVSDRCQWLPPDRWLLNLAGLERLRGEDEAIARRLRSELRRARLRPALGVAATRSAALLAAAAAATLPGGFWAVPTRETTAALGRLPLAVLRGLAGCITAPAGGGGDKNPLACLELFERWGVTTLAELAALPPRGIAERLGKAGLRWQRWARGEDAGLLVPEPRPETPAESGQSFEPPLEDSPPLLAWLERECGQTCQALEKPDRAIGGLELELELTAGQPWRWGQEWAMPHRDARRLQQQLEIAVATRPPTAAIAAARLRFLVARPRRIQPRLFGEAEVESERTERLLARLCALLEDAEGRRIGAAQLRDLHRGDAFTTVPYRPEEAAVAAGSRREGSGLCLRALRPPPRIEVRFPALPAGDSGWHLRGALCRLPQGPAMRVLHASGPWRSSGEWWKDAGWSADEWDVELAGGKLCRLRYDRKAKAWSLAGEYD